MQSFKEFMSKESHDAWQVYQLGKAPIVEFDMDFYSSRLGDEYHMKDGKFYRLDMKFFEKKFAQNLKKTTGKKNLSVKVLQNGVAVDELRIGYNPFNDEEGSQEYIHSIDNKIITACKQLLNDHDVVVSNFRPTSVWINNTLSTKIDWPEVNLSYRKNTHHQDITLINISKFLHTESIFIYGDDEVKSGGLGLLKIKELKKIVNLNDAEEKWLSIVKAYIKSKDILNCQEELIDAGLKDFAKI
jgi:hypothetical protein